MDLGLAGWCKIVGGSRDVLGCPMATWDNSDQGLAGWCKVVGYPGLSHGNLGQLRPGTGRVVVGSGMSRDVLGCPRISQVVPWQLETTGTWDWQGGVM